MTRWRRRSPIRSETRDAALILVFRVKHLKRLVVLDERAGRLRARRREQERAAAEIASDTSELLRRFAVQLSVSDAAVLLGVSKGRISQLRSRSAGQSTTAARPTGTDG
jgi:hypothetical protein